MPPTTDQEPEDFLTPAEASRYLRVSTRTLQRYEAAGHLQVSRLPTGHRRYRRADLDALSAPRRTAPAVNS